MGLPPLLPALLEERGGKPTFPTCYFLMSELRFTLSLGRQVRGTPEAVELHW